jgi:O-antigen ligase
MSAAIPISVGGRWPGRIALSGAVLMVTLPFFITLHVLPIGSFYEEWLAGALGLIVAAILLSRAELPSVPSGVMWLLAFAGVLPIPLFLGRVPYGGQIAVAELYVLWTVLLYCAGARLRDFFGIERLVRIMSVAIAAGGVLSALIALIQVFGGGSALTFAVSPLIGNRAYGNTNQANLFAHYVALGFCALAYLWLVGTARTRLAAGLALLLLAGLALSGSRSVWLYLIWLIAWSGAWWLKGRTAAAVKLSLFAIAGLIAFAAVALLLGKILTDGLQLDTGVFHSLQFGLPGQAASDFPMRTYFWAQAWKTFLEAPLVGVGFGQYFWHFFQLSLSFESPPFLGEVRYAHNLILHLLAETGLAGTLCIVVLLTRWWWDLWRKLDRPEHWLLGAWVGVTLIHSMLEIPLWYAHFLGLTALALGVGDDRRIVLSSSRPLQSVALPAVLGGAFVLASLGYQYVRISAWLYNFADLARVDPVAAERQQEVIRSGKRSLLRPYVDLPLSATLALDPGELDAKIEFNGRVMRFAPIGPVVYRQALFLGLAGRTDEAETLLRPAFHIYPELIPEFSSVVNELRHKYPERLERVQALLEEQRSGVQKPDSNLR